MTNSGKLNVVFDTNIYISAVLFGGNPGEVYRMGLNGAFRLNISTGILREIEECLVQKFCGTSFCSPETASFVQFQKQTG